MLDTNTAVARGMGVPMVNLLLTDQSIRAIALPQNGQVDYFDTSLAGFGVRVSPQGTKAFFLLTGKKNNRRRQGLGRYGIITLSQARAAATKRLAEADARDRAGPDDYVLRGSEDL